MSSGESHHGVDTICDMAQAPGVLFDLLCIAAQIVADVIKLDPRGLDPLGGHAELRIMLGEGLEGSNGLGEQLHRVGRAAADVRPRELGATYESLGVREAVALLLQGAALSRHGSQALEGLDLEAEVVLSARLIPLTLLQNLQRFFMTPQLCDGSRHSWQVLFKARVGVEDPQVTLRVEEVGVIVLPGDIDEPARQGLEGLAWSPDRR